jgi:RHS repeat-associated protein
VLYFDGTVRLDTTDLASDGFGTPWGVTRSWTNGVGYAQGNFSGNNTLLTQLPHLVPVSNSTTLILITNGTNARYFDFVNGQYAERFYLNDGLTAPQTTDFVVTDGVGDKLDFYSFNSSVPAYQQGLLKSDTDPDGNVTTVLGYTSFGAPTEIQRSNTANGVTVTESFLYTYSGGMLANVTLRRQTNGGAWTTIRQVAYTYYDGVLAHGNAGDLQFAKIEDGAGNVLDTKYYRYYTGEAGGYVGGLKYVFNPASYARLAAAFTDPTTATDAQVAPYADNYFEYDTSQRVTKEVVQGAGCSSCGTGQGTFTYSYSMSSFSQDYNTWMFKTVETLPDGNQNFVYCNGYGEVMLQVYHDVGLNQNWEMFYKYDGAGRIILTAYPSALTGYDETTPDLLNSVNGNYQYLADNAGLVAVTDYVSGSSYVGDRKVQQGELGTPVLQESDSYISQTAGSVTVTELASQTVYRNPDGTGAETTNYSYTWFSGTVQIQSETVSRPVIAAGQNGPGVADTDTTYFDVYGRPIWHKDGDGLLTYTAYDQATGASVTSITDVNTNDTGEFQNLPSGWATPSGGGLNLVMQFTVDGLGRTTKAVTPAGNVTYTVYDDVNHAVRVYAVWNSSTNLPTGPTVVYREDRGHDPSYTETLTMSATPHLTNGVPDGTEAISGLQTLARTYISDGGQVTRTDAYFNLAGLTYSTALYIGTAGTNYYSTTYGYDERGRRNRVQRPTGTIERTVYDGLGRVVSTWVGTNDTGATDSDPTGGHAAGNNMVQFSSNVYDSGGVGDGDLTQATDYPGGTAANRVTQDYYDWRDRLVVSKQGVQASENDGTHRPILYYTLNNLGEVTAVSHYDGDGVTITYTNGVPNQPAANLLRAYSTIAHDDQHRIYATNTYSVDQTNGTVSTGSLATNYYFDHRGDLVATLVPGGLWSKQQFDGAGRLTITYSTDGAGGTTWAAAVTTANDTVLEQGEQQYDADGNTIETIDRQRFDSAIGTGPLGSPSSGIGARVYYTASYYDAADRLTASVNVGTNGGAAWTRPGTVPTDSNTVLVTGYTYNAAGWLDTTTDPRGIVGKNFYDALGRVTKTIAAYTDGTPTNNTNQTTEFTFDGDGHTLTLQADEPGGAYQRTQYVYGVTTVGGSDVNSNDFLAAVQYPDPTTGNPSSAQQVSYTVNALGQTKAMADRDGNVHTYSFDVLGRQTADAVTTLGAGVDGSVRRIETAYDTGDRPYLYTSYNSASGGSIVNQVEDLYNGLGQLTTEYQSHAGGVNPNSTPSVQYAYTLMAGGANNSRLTSITYPNGRVIAYNYNTGLDSNISRLSSLSDSTGVLEAYTYLGLNTVVKRAHPQPGVDLTYIKQLGEANGDAGDQYIGLDRFGRVVDQRWIISATGVATDRFQYGYDRDGNALYKSNLVNPAFSELYHANGAANGYDQLNQLVAFARGTLSDTNGDGIPDTIASPTASESWTLDALGNWGSFTSNGTTQTRTANQQNQITSISGQTTPTYDANGNTTTDQTGKTFIYDAWNRLVQVKSGNTILISYAYDALNRRIIENPGTARDLFFSKDWQVVEERVGGTPNEQYVWSPVYVDALVERDRDADGNPNNGLEERLYAQQNANWNVTAVISAAGAVQERYIEDPYGQVSILAPDWSARVSSLFAWIYLHQGGRFDSISGLYSFEHRDDSSALGRWVEQDPKGLSAGDFNLYRSAADNPTRYFDPTGLELPPNGGYDRFIPPGPESAIKICHRDINVGPNPDFKVKCGAKFCGHTYVGYGTDEKGNPRGVGLWDTGAKQGDLPSDENTLSVYPPKRCSTCYKSPKKTLQGGSGKGKKGTQATDQEIWDCITKHRLTHDYSTVTYNCGDWASEAADSCGLSCSPFFKKL